MRCPCHPKTSESLAHTHLACALLCRLRWLCLQLHVANLKSILLAKGLSIAGKKAELIERAKDAIPLTLTHVPPAGDDEQVVPPTLPSVAAPAAARAGGTRKASSAPRARGTALEQVDDLYSKFFGDNSRDVDDSGDDDDEDDEY